MSLQQVTIIIRAAGERTVELCKKLILDQGVAQDDVFVVQEVPFSATMRKSFITGIERGRKWTFCVDADVLLRPGSVNHMIELAERQKKNVCEIQGYMMDRFFGGARIGGVHLYRTSLLPEVLARIPEEGTDIRPEKYVLTKMQEDGYPWLTVPYIVGTHDDEQYNIDIYRKAFVQAVKHVSRVELFITLWRERCREDSDYLVALRGLSDSIRNREEVYIDKEQSLYTRLFREAGFDEKPDLDISQYSLEHIEERVQNWTSPDIYFTYFPSRDGLDSHSSANWRKVRQSIRKSGVFGTVVMVISDLLIRAGKRLRGWV